MSRRSSHRRIRVASARLPIRSADGFLMPLLAVMVVLMMGTLGMAMDLERDFEAVHQLGYAAKMAGTYGLSLATNTDGSYSVPSAQANIQNAVIAAGTNAWFTSQTGPVNNVWSNPVTFANTDVQFINNPNTQDPNDFLVQVTARCTGSNALKQFFLPLLETKLPGTSINNDLSTVSTAQTVELVGQPASCIGAAAPLNSPAGTRAQQLIGFAALPLAISNQQFASIANPSQTLTTYTIDFVTSRSAELVGPAPAGHLKACLVNVASSGGGLNFYGPAQGNSAINQLEGLLSYFGAPSNQATQLPAAVERGSQLSGFDPADPTFASRAQEISQVISLLPNKFYVVPVLVNDPSFSTTNAVAGFARMSLSQFTFNKGLPVSATVTIGESVPERNASSVTGFASIPQFNGTQLPAPVFPFTPRTFDPVSQGVSTRPRAVVMAPALSPREISNTQQLGNAAVIPY